MAISNQVLKNRVAMLLEQQSIDLDTWEKVVAFRVIKRAIQDIGIKNSSDGQGNVDSTRDFKLGRLDGFALAIGIDPEFMRDTLKRVKLL